MAVVYWSGAGADDKFSTAGNWTGGLPGTGDTAIINASSDNIVTETYATAFAELRISEGFTGTVGVTVDTGVALTVTATTVVIDCTAKVYLDTTSTLVLVERTAGGDDAVRLTGTITTLRVLDARGTIVLGEAAALAVSDLEFLGGRFATVEVQTTTTLAAAPVSMNEGTLKIYGMAVAATGTWDLVGGTVELHAGDYTTATFEIWNNARVEDKRDANSTIATINMYGGNWNGGESTADLLIIGALKLYGDAKFDERNGLLNYQYTTGVTFAGEGTFRAATARELSQG